jgi:hypothetical protein
VDFVGDASDFTGRRAGSPRVPSHPTRPRSSAVTCTNGLSMASAVTRRLRPFRPIPRGRASGGAKVERNSAAVRPELRTPMAAAPRLSESPCSRSWETQRQSERLGHAGSRPMPARSDLTTTVAGPCTADIAHRLKPLRSLDRSSGPGPL